MQDRSYHWLMHAIHTPAIFRDTLISTFHACRRKSLRPLDPSKRNIRNAKLIKNKEKNSFNRVLRVWRREKEGRYLLMGAELSSSSRSPTCSSSSWSAESWRRRGIVAELLSESETACGTGTRQLTARRPGFVSRSLFAAAAGIGPQDPPRRPPPPRRGANRAGRPPHWPCSSTYYPLLLCLGCFGFALCTEGHNRIHRARPRIPFLFSLFFFFIFQPSSFALSVRAAVALKLG